MASDPALFAGACRRRCEDVRRTVDLLASRPEIDPRRIGVMGISLGGILAAVGRRARPAARQGGARSLPAAICCPSSTRPAKPALLSRDAAGCRPERRAEVERPSATPIRCPRRPAARAGRGGQGADAQCRPKTKSFPAPAPRSSPPALGIADRVVWLDGLGHYTAMAALPRALRDDGRFLRRRPAAGQAKPPAAAAKPHAAGDRRRSLGQQAAILPAEPEPGHCHFAELDVSVAGPDGKTYDGQVRFVRGAEGRIPLRLPAAGGGPRCRSARAVPGWPPTASASSWASARPRPPAARWLRRAVAHDAFADARRRAGHAGAWPPTSWNAGSRSAKNRPTAGRARCIARKGGAGDCRPVIELDDGPTPRRISSVAGRPRARSRFVPGNSTSPAIDAMFEPPAGLPPKEVEAADLCRCFRRLQLRHGA